jgi:hypothetical protein
MDAGMLAYKESFERFFRLGEDAGAAEYEKANKRATCLEARPTASESRGIS